ncbi:MAG: hypothetical protein ABEJ26_02310 [Halosimplex sp.]
MGLLSKHKRLVGLAERYDDKVAKHVSKRSDKLDEGDMKNGIDATPSKIDEEKQ